MVDDSDEHDSLSSRVRQVFQEQGADPTDNIPLPELTSPGSVMEGKKTDRFHTTYFNPKAGWCDAALASASLTEAAEKRGVKRITCQATDLLIDATSGRVSGVRTVDGGTFEADIVVLATGAWTGYLLSPVEDALDMPEQDRIEH